MRKRSAESVFSTVEAENDLFEIGMYTLTEWGEEQFERYMALLRDVCEQILPRKHGLARRVAERPGLMRWRCERHMIYFGKVSKGLEIVRILHDRRLPSKHL